MEAGSIVEQGSHDELLAARGAYWRLYNAQFDAPAVDDADEEPALVVPERVPTEPVPVVSPGAVPPLPPVPPETDDAGEGAEGAEGPGPSSTRV
ncbi:hypothetical protein [Microbacterium lacticum]|nr:hypothetical protein MLA01_17230 [Microbacterium lacticum]GGI67116.1 hypothetical protein GCM10009724_17810 [Microbacterium lacticum]